MKILDVGEPFDCSDLSYKVYVIVDKVLPCIYETSRNHFLVRNPGTVGLDYDNMSPVTVIEVIGNMVELRAWDFFKICPGQLLEPDIPDPAAL